MTSEEIERTLQTQIDPWLTHMRWRADFEEWRRKRLWQENYQAEALADVRNYGDGATQARILDLGAGMGGFAVALAREPISPEQGKRSVFAMDYNPAYAEITQTRARRYELHLPTLVAAGEALPFANESFGLLTCWDVVEHVQDPDRLVSEIARVLRPGGCAFLTVINRYALVDPHYHLRFVNWMPRALAERYITWRQRTKNTPLRDRQKLSEMHYYTYAGAVHLAARFGLRVKDMNAARSRFKRLPQSLGRALYWLWRTLGMGTYRLVVTKQMR